MLDHKDVLRALVRSVNGQNTVFVRETNFGYVIRSEKTGDLGALRTRAAQFVLAAFVAAALVVWIAPSGINSFALNALVSLSCVASGFVGFALIRNSSSGIELHVDVTRQELRSAVVTAKGESWIRSSARFKDVSDVYLRRTTNRIDLRSLCLRINGEEQLMPVAIGGERILLTVHDRLMQDVRPVVRATTQMDGVMRPAVRSSSREVFPQLGPDEQRA